VPGPWFDELENLGSGPESSDTALFSATSISSSMS